MPGHKGKHTVRTVCLALLLLFLWAVPVSAEPVFGSSSKENTIRLGFFEFGGMFEGASEEAPKSGYCYEYMMEVAVYTGWNYEFVYGTYSELYERLRKGEIDILPYTNYNEQREREVLFSEQVLAEEEYYLVVRPDSEVFVSGDLESLSGKTVSTLTGADYNSLLLDYIRDTGLEIDVTYYDSLEETWEALRNGSADATVYTNRAYGDDFQCFCTFGNKPTYIAVSKEKPELLNQLNRATELIKAEDPALLGDLSSKYFSDNPMRRTLTLEEQQWIDAHPVLRVGGFSSNPTDLQIEEGTATGLTVDILNGIMEKLNIRATVDYHLYNTTEEMREALEKGEIDVIYPFYPNHSIAQERGLIISRDVRTANMELVYRTETSYTEALTKIATPTIRLGIFYVLEHYPDCEIVEADSVVDAVKKVRNGEALGAVAYNQAIHSETEKHVDLTSQILPYGCGTCFAATPENYELIMVLNRGLNFFTADEIAALAAKHQLAPTITTIAYLSSHKDVVFLCILILIAMVALAISLIQQNHLKKKAEEANRSKTSFLFNMSHDIRTPMNAIIGFNEMAIRHKDDRPVLEASLEKTRISSEYLLKIINDILDMARIESGKLVIKEQLNDVEGGSRMVLDLFGNEAAKKGITLHSSFSVRDPYLWFDGDHTLQIVANLLSNAVKYTDEGGDIWYSVEQKPSEKEGCGTFVITVRDNGRGMSPEFLKKIYQAFERDPSAITSRSQGTGLGMSIVKNLADAMGSRIEIRSELGKGTTVTVTSVHRIATEAEIEQFRREHDLSVSDVSGNFIGKRVLLVEDNELNREISTDILKEEGFLVEEAEDGTVAVEKMKENGPDRYDFILMDIQMPKMNGYEATKAIRTMYPDRHIPIVAVSANAFEEDRAASLAAGMDAHVPKPVEVKELMKILAHLL